MKNCQNTDNRNYKTGFHKIDVDFIKKCDEEFEILLEKSVRVQEYITTMIFGRELLKEPQRRVMLCQELFQHGTTLLVREVIPMFSLKQHQRSLKNTLLNS